MTCGSCSLAAIRDSRLNRSWKPASADISARNSLIATVRSLAVSQARYTSPIPPTPSNDCRSYGPNIVPTREPPPAIRGFSQPGQFRVATIAARRAATSPPASTAARSTAPTRATGPPPAPPNPVPEQVIHVPCRSDPPTTGPRRCTAGSGRRTPPAPTLPPPAPPAPARNRRTAARTSPVPAADTPGRTAGIPEPAAPDPRRDPP